MVEPRTTQPPGTEGCVLPGIHTASARATMGDLTVPSEYVWAVLGCERRGERVEEGGKEKRKGRTEAEGEEEEEGKGETV